MDINTLMNFISAFGFGKDLNKDKSPRTKDWETAAEILGATATARRGSIKYRAKDLIAHYPVLFSDNLTSHSVQLVNRALEHEYVNMLKLLIQNDGADGFENTASYLKGYHQNISHDANLDSHLSKSTDELERRFSESVITENDLRDANKKLLESFSDDLNLQVLNDSTVSKEYKNLLEDKKDDSNNKKVEKELSAKPKIDNTEIKKANELTPTNVSVDIDYETNNGTVHKTISFGVKCVAHLLDSQDIEYFLPNAVITKTPIMRMIQWTSGEIKFFKDFLFSIDEIKRTAVKSNDKNSFWWRKLQTISKVAHARPSLFALSKGRKLGKAPIPTSTMVISKENVDNIRHKHGIDLLAKPSFVKKIMKNFFLMTFIIVDESIETVYIFNEDTGDFSHYSFKSLEGFSKQKNIDIKDIYSLLK
ncbi:hypothetical protein INTERNEXUS_95 [Bacillus phage vB_BspM_Internexus]|nr:hypothetical protein INTERNEXUS_95 [Bacillus phage vB_BspM_Internexus]